MLAKVNSAAVVGLNGVMVEVEVDVSGGLPSMTIVGLPDTVVNESRERVRSAIRNAGCSFPTRKITVNLAPADLRKAGPAYDLPIAVGILLSSEQISFDTSKVLFLGELSLDGGLRHIHGILPMVVLAKEKGFSSVFVPPVDAREAALVRGIKVFPAESLAQLVAHFRGRITIPDHVAEGNPLEQAKGVEEEVDTAYIKGQEHAKRALEVVAAGGHNVLMMGPPGAGKTLLARALRSILPRMSFEESLEVTQIYSVSGLLPPDTPLLTQRPFRAPHYTISNIGLVGGGKFPRPGEISLSHRGVLFLDELPEFGHANLEVLRQPLEDRVVTITRAQGSVNFPANFMLVGAMNPCPCGYFGDSVKPCTCSPGLIYRYRRRISGPLLDRFDIFIDVPRLEYEKLSEEKLEESSEEIQARVEAARMIQRERFKGTKLSCNANMTPVEVRQSCRLGKESQGLLRAAVKQLSLSARGFHRLLKLARTIADLASEKDISSTHLAEALQYRPKDLYNIY